MIAPDAARHGSHHHLGASKYPNYLWDTCRLIINSHPMPEFPYQPMSVRPHAYYQPNFPTHLRLKILLFSATQALV